MQILASPFVVLKLLLGALLLAALGGSPARAANLSVNTLSATHTADGLCTLSEAIINANEDSDTTSGDCAAGSGADTITFRVSGTITLDNTLPNITDVDGLSIDGNGQNVTVSGNNAVQVMRVEAGATLKLLHLTVANGFLTFPPFPGNSDGGGIYNAGTLNVSNSTFSGNFTISGGGGIYNIGTLTVNHSIFKGNSAFFGGGITNRGGTLTVTDSTFSGNESTSSGGGIENLAGTVSITGSTFTRNSNDSSGGGIDNEGGTLIVSNSTISGNFAAAGGGGIASTGTLTVVHSTISGNSATFAGGILVSRGIFNLANSIVANNTGHVGEEDCRNSAGTVNSSGVNLVEDGSCGADSDPLHFITGDPLLGPLADNGGPTQTHALLAGSIAIDKANNAICAAAPVNNLDQRGQSRPVDGDDDGTPVCDIGAYEFVPAYLFSGFFPPVDNPPTVNTAKAGSAIPIKFRLGGDFGLNIFATLYPKSQPVACESGAPQDDLEQTVTPGSSSLSYDPTTDTYTYVWETSKVWAGTCRQFIVKLNDATEHAVLFSFK
ncbi:MAG TPA: PxKF domain-containing protein [Methylobacter sp.]|jgi:hypothetical protein